MTPSYPGHSHVVWPCSFWISPDMATMCRRSSRRIQTHVVLISHKTRWTSRWVSHDSSRNLSWNAARTFSWRMTWCLSVLLWSESMFPSDEGLVLHWVKFKRPNVSGPKLPVCACGKETSRTDLNHDYRFWILPMKTRTHTRTHTRSLARTHARSLARTHAHIHVYVIFPIVRSRGAP